ncbi:MAG: ATP-binding cassette domain-containing protein [Mycoplasmoidaceae bacterium]|nr:ATP-binding cassette domain-containing protein [Mycoplasmoidaceae bacterium]
MKDKIINKNLNTNNVITCDNLTITVGSKKYKSILIDKFDYSFEKNKVYAIVGKSGSGKTTLVSHLNGLKRSKSGLIFIKDYYIDPKKRKLRKYKDIRKEVALVFQFPEYQLFKDTVEKDIMYGPINYHVNKAKAKEIASKYMYLVGLDRSLLNENPFDLSNGQKRLVAIAGILAIESDVIIVDEPMAGIDPHGQALINQLIKQLKQKGKTIIIVTHNMDNVLDVADQVLVLYNNQLYKTGSPYKIFTNNELLDEVGLRQPNVIKTINLLIHEKKDYSYLLELQPKNLTELILGIKKGGL